MKRNIFFLVLIIFLSRIATAQYVQLGASPMRALLISKYPACFNAALELDTTCTAITSETLLDVSNQSLNSVYGLQFFDNLQTLNFKGASAGDLFTYIPQSVEILDISNSFPGYLTNFPANLTWFDCSDFAATVGDVFPPFPAGLQYFKAVNFLGDIGNNTSWPSTLEYINVSHCQFSFIPTLPPGLDTLIVDSQVRYGALTAPPLSSLPALPSTLKYLDCSNNGLSSIPSLPGGLKFLKCDAQAMQVNSALTYEEVPGLTGLPTLPPALEYLSCRYNGLSGLSALPPTLTYLDCEGNQFYHPVFDGVDNTIYSSPGIPNLPSLPAALAYLNVGSNGMTILPALSPALLDLTISNTNINALPDLPAGLRYLDFNGTSLSCLPYLPSSLLLQSPFRTQQIDLVINNNINCLPNRLAGLRIKKYDYPNYADASLPVCNAFNNLHGCPLSPTMAGLCFYDNNSNGTQDPGELPMGGVQLSLGNTDIAFSSDDGLYAIGGGLGINNLTVTPRPYYTAVPASLSYNFAGNDTLVNAIIALQPNATIDSLKISITALYPARPGFDFAYQVKFENVGTTVMANAVVAATFDATKLAYQNSSPGVLQSGGSLTFNAGTLTPGQRGEFVGNFILNTAVPLGADLLAGATITSGTKIYSDQSVITVQGSFDPNEKYATKVLSRQEVADGAYIDYTICFQNTGTDTAFNVQLLDELDLKLDAATFVPVASSHACISKRTGNYLSFEFRNILLPDETTNAAASHGYIRFKIKPLAGLPDNSTIPNSAGIYFDFNAPVITQPVSSLVNPAVVPVLLGNFTAQKTRTQVLLNWNTVQEINSSNFMLERAGADTHWKNITTLPAAGNSQSTVFYQYSDFIPLQGLSYYRLRINDLDGHYTYSPVRQITFGKELQIALTPNPAHNLVMLSVQPAMIGSSYAVFDQFARRIADGKILQANIVMNISRWQPGIYYFTIISKDGKVEKLEVY